MKTYTMESAVANFDELMRAAQEGLTVYIIGNDGREYELILKRMPAEQRRQPNMFKGQIEIAEDFDAPLPEFEPYTK